MRLQAARLHSGSICKQACHYMVSGDACRRVASFPSTMHIACNDAPMLSSGKTVPSSKNRPQATGPPPLPRT